MSEQQTTRTAIQGPVLCVLYIVCRQHGVGDGDK